VAIETGLLAVKQRRARGHRNFELAARCASLSKGPMRHAGWC